MYVLLPEGNIVAFPPPPAWKGKVIVRGMGPAETGQQKQGTIISPHSHYFAQHIIRNDTIY